jgi:methyl coenzyme M reductase subunit D
LEKVLGSSKVQPNNRITIIKQVQKKLKVKIGEIIVYVEDEKGNIIIKKGQLKTI